MPRKKNNSTTLMRVYKDDLKEVRGKFGNVKMADFFRVTIRTNPFVQMEAALRKDAKKNRKNKKK